MLEKLKERLDKLPEAIGEEFISTLNEYTPVRTGTLRDGNRFEIRDGKIVIINEVEYFDYVNNGTEHIRPRLFLDTTVNELDQIVKRAMEKLK